MMVVVVEAGNLDKSSLKNYRKQWAEILIGPTRKLSCDDKNTLVLVGYDSPICWIVICVAIRGFGHIDVGPHTRGIAIPGHEFIVISYISMDLNFVHFKYFTCCTRKVTQLHDPFYFVLIGIFNIIKTCIYAWFSSSTSMKVALPVAIGLYLLSPICKYWLFPSTSTKVTYLEKANISVLVFPFICNYWISHVRQ